MRLEKKDRLKKKAIKTLIKNNIMIYATSSIYTSYKLGVALLGGNDSKFHYIKENSENKLISLIDKKNKKRLDRLNKIC